MAMVKIPLGISACLLGEHVRYDGGHKHDRYLTGVLGAFVDFVPVCPEVGCGLPVPREAMRLEGDPATPRLMTRVTRRDMTKQMQQYCVDAVNHLAQEGLCGFIFKKDSPSSGLFRVKVYDGTGMPKKTGRGLFAAAVAERFPTLPLEEAERLNDPDLRENFIERVFSLHRWRQFVEGRPTLGDLVQFHTRHKLVMMAHSPQAYREMGRMVAHGAEMPFAELLLCYEVQFMKGLAAHATVKKNTNVLQHIMGYFKRQLSADEKEELLEVIAQYHGGQLPLIVPITLLRHYIRKFDQPYLREQLYLSPHPAELMLRNHV